MSQDEIVDIVDESCRILGSISKHEAHAQGILHKTVVAHVRTSDGRFLLVKQSAGRQDADQYIFPVGGHVSSGEDDLEAMKRETLEELGLSNVEPQELGRSIYYREVIGRKENHLFIVYEIISDDTPTHNHESVECRYFTIEELKESIKQDRKMFGDAFYNVADKYFNYLYA